MTRTKPTVADLLAGKGKLQRTNVLAWTVDEAAAAEEAGIDIVTTGHNPQLAAIRAAAPTAFMITGMDYGRLATTDDYLREACTLYQLGVDAMYCVASLETISRLTAEGFPIISHVGLIPSKATWTGGFRAVGKTAEAAMKIYRQIERLEDAGAFGAEIEVVPAEVASAISARTSLFMMSMGAGAGCDAQYLFAEDILGSHEGHYPRHAKRYRDLRRGVRAPAARTCRRAHRVSRRRGHGPVPRAGPSGADRPRGVGEIPHRTRRIDDSRVGEPG